MTSTSSLRIGCTPCSSVRLWWFRLAMWLLMRSPDPGAARTILRGDLLTIPLAVLVTCVAYVVLRRVRRRRAALDRALDFDGALRTVLDGLARKVAVSPSSSLQTPRRSGYG